MPLKPEGSWHGMFDPYGAADIAWLDRCALLLGIKPIATAIPLVPSDHVDQLPALAFVVPPEQIQALLAEHIEEVRPAINEINRQQTRVIPSEE